ncbi:hypothetical protein [Erythrobacter sp.]|jgi:hypothetical protein|uniref:hypothetical protein n=1 Tax=Erythrobacter sp. TaxID=1042 RepID=UPI002ECBAA4C|nr:hypothetical protein [Erythrobacter sp.]
MIRPALLRLALPLATLLFAAPDAAARQSLGVFESWAAFRDTSPARCYAIAMPRGGSEDGAYASIATWPARGVRGQVHLRLSQVPREGSAVWLTIGQRRFDLAAQGRNAWAQDAAMDAAIVAALRSSGQMRVSARSRSGRRFSDRYDLPGVATAIDASLVSCASR